MTVLSSFFKILFRAAFLVLLGLLWSLPMGAEHFRHLNLGDGLSQPSVMAVCQDGLGRMWFGTREGVNVFDGRSIRSYKGMIRDQKNGEDLWIGNEVEMIVKDHEDNLYMVIDGDIVGYEPVAEKFTRFTDGGNAGGLSSYGGKIAYIVGDSVFQKDAGDSKAEFLFRALDTGRVRSFEITDSEYIIGTEYGVHIYDSKGRKLRRLLDGKDVYSTFVSGDGTLWISVQSEGLYKAEKGSGEARLVSVPKAPSGVRGGQQIRRAIEDRNGKIWYGSFSGLFCYDPATGETAHIELPANAGGLSHSSIFGMYMDRQGTIWVGCYYGGVNYFSPNQERFFNFDYDRVAPKGMFHSIVTDIEEDRDGNLWFGTDGAGVSCVDSNWNIITQLNTRSGELALRQNNIKCLAYDSLMNRVFIGTHLGGLSYYDIGQRKTVNLIDGNKEISRAVGDVVHDLKVKGDKLFITSRKGISRLDMMTGEMVGISEMNPVRFDISRRGNIYFQRDGSVYELSGVMEKNPKPELRKLATDVDGVASVLATDSAVFIGTLGRGLYRISTADGKTKQINSHNSMLPSNYCYALQKGRDGIIYAATENNIVRLNENDGSVMSIDFREYFPDSHILAESGFKVGDDGTLFVGSTKGITVIREDNFNEHQPQDQNGDDFFLSNLSVQGREVRANDGSGVLEAALPFAKEIRLNPDQNNISLQIAKSDYVNNANAFEFQYKLKGVDDDWIPSENGYIHYTNLAPGSYELRVRRDPQQSGADGHEIKLKVTVERPLYARWWAILIYIAISGAVCWYLLMKARDFARVKRSLRKEKLERQQIEKLNQEKLVFFTNVSHEFQTPLTLIMSHVDLMLAKVGRNDRLKGSLERVRAHTEQMSHLITQLLEFRKLQQNHQTIRIGRHNVSRLLEESSKAFIEYAERRNIEFKISVPETPVEAYLDPRLIDRVLVNLISNAFKYTPDGGKIECSVETDDKGRAVIKCRDNGKGISEADLPFIFDRFYNGSADEIKYNDFHYKTTGIGLAFAKSIVDNHHGEIKVESKESEGTEFKVILPCDENMFEGDRNVVMTKTEVTSSTDEKEKPIVQNMTVLPQQPEEESNVEAEGEDDDERSLLLIVEDNPELRNNLKVFFSNYYRVAEADNGEEGLEKARELNPDLIISDVLMPKMDGTEMCRRIKTEMALCHIPVILLTALSATESRLEGLNANADDYVTKPYESSVLLARVDNLLRIRKMLRSQFDSRPVSEIDITVVNPLDRDLLKRTSEVIDAHISDCEFDIPQLCSELAISRSLFYNKFKSLTGMTPSAFILNYRLKHAAALLTAQPHISVTEVADMSGFSTTVYFSRCFKKQFGVPPQKYRSDETATLGLST